MSRMTKEINKVTGAVIGISGKLIIYAIVLFLLVEGMTRGYAFGHSIFYSTSMEEAPGTDRTVVIGEGQTVSETARQLKTLGLISSELAMQIQVKFYDYDIYPGTYVLNTSMTSKELLQILNEKPKEEEETAEASGERQTKAAPAAPAAADQDSGDQEIEIRINGTEYHGGLA